MYCKTTFPVLHLGGSITMKSSENTQQDTRHPRKKMSDNDGSKRTRVLNRFSDYGTRMIFCYWPVCRVSGTCILMVDSSPPSSLGRMAGFAST